MQPQRKQQRLARFDYAAPGTTFVTICLDQRLPLLGRVVDDRVELSATGDAVNRVLLGLSERFANLEIDGSIVMPDHVHALIVVRTGCTTSVSTAVQAFKSVAAHAVREHRGAWGRFWQRGFYDHVVRDDDDLARCREYIATNPARWTASRLAREETSSSPTTPPAHARRAGPDAANEPRHVPGL